VTSPPLVPASLETTLRERLRASENWLRFDLFMDHALYTPHTGYYCRQEIPFGFNADFVTAPALSPLFGACVGRQIAEVLEALEAQGAQEVKGAPSAPGSPHAGQVCGTPCVVEFGAGDGRLATQVLAALRQRGIAPQYHIVEVSAPLRSVQYDRILRHAPQDLPRVAWLEHLPEPGFRGVILANEVLDAMPVRLFVFAGEDQGKGRWFERGVSIAGALPHDHWSAAERLVFADRDVDVTQSSLLDAHRARCQSVWQEPWPSGMIVEWHEQAQAWLRTLAKRIGAGMILLIDYGFPAHEYYLPARHMGTLVAHRAQRVTTEVLAHPGQQDLSVHLDFTALAQVGLEAGLELSGYCTQARFLLNCGLLELASSPTNPLVAQPPDALRAWASVEQASHLAGVQRLISDAEMGELFKVMAFTRGIPSELLGFSRGDRRGRLGLEATLC
jgi:SAM-dependent MidA family methyltransferase